MRVLSLRALALPLSLSLGLVGCDMADDDGDTDDTDTTEETDDTMTEDTDPGSIVDIAADTPRFSTLVEAVTKAGLAGALDDVTVFAPNNTAFDALFTALDVDGVDDLSVDQLTAVLTYHVLAGEVDSTAAIGVANGAGTADALGGSLDLSLDGDDLKIDDATVIAPDIMANNGIIHEIDAVLVPNIVDIVTTDADLGSLTAALVAVDEDEDGTDLIGTLGEDGPFTVFAPDDDAFAAMLSANSAADLGAFATAVGIDTVRDVLTYHVSTANPALDSTDVVGADGSTVTTLGGTFTVDVDGSTVTLNEGVSGVAGTNDATVTVVDIIASNGIIHKLDAVITPASGGEDAVIKE